MVVCGEEIRGSLLKATVPSFLSVLVVEAVRELASPSNSR